MDAQRLTKLKSTLPKEDHSWAGTKADNAAMTSVAQRLVNTLVSDIEAEEVPSPGRRLCRFDEFIVSFFELFDARSVMRETSPEDNVYHFMLTVADAAELPEQAVGRSWRLISEAMG